ncbi:MAG: Hsp70 family protein [Anaerolineae bacterium]|nr:Hsp70 family protein [Anaerolineae bacterium]
MKLAIDFGTTNSVIARWDSGTNQAEIVAVPGISTPTQTDRPLLVPSLLYVGEQGRISVGQAVIDGQLNYQRDNRLFRNFKRGIVASSAPAPREIDGAWWADRDAGQRFIRHLVQAMPQADTIDQLVLTAPVASFEGYLAWLNAAIDGLEGIAPDNIRIVDESTAAALGYAVTEPGAVVLVFDFGGGTLDLSLVQLPESREKTGGLLKRLLRGSASGHTARVIAKAGRIIGGSDIDQWLLTYVLQKANLSIHELGNNYAALLTRCEQAKIALSTAETVTVACEAGGTVHHVDVTRAELETLLTENGFYTALRRVVDKVMHVAHGRGIFREDITYVLMVGGISLMPFVQRTLQQYFTDMALRADKPFTAIAEGALQVAAGYGLDDYLVHSYGIRHLDPQANEHQYDEIIPMGSRYPLDKPVEVMMGAAHDQQAAVELIIGEIDADAVSMLEVRYDSGQAVFVAQADRNGQQIVPLNEDRAAHMLARLVPPGVPGQDRLKAQFTIDDRRQLRVTVNDLKTGKVLLRDAVVVTLR